MLQLKTERKLGEHGSDLQLGLLGRTGCPADHAARLSWIEVE